MIEDLEKLQILNEEIKKHHTDILEYYKQRLETQQRYISKLESLIFQYGDECTTISDKEIWTKLFRDLPDIMNNVK